MILDHLDVVFLILLLFLHKAMLNLEIGFHTKLEGSTNYEVPLNRTSFEQKNDSDKKN